jgi:hypothetical protein
VRVHIPSPSEEKAGRPSDVALRGLPDERAHLLWSLAILFRTNGITANVENKETFETAQKIPAQKSVASRR